MKLVHVSLAAALTAIGSLCVGIGTHDWQAVVAAVTGLGACFLPSVVEWFNPKT